MHNTFPAGTFTPDTRRASAVGMVLSQASIESRLFLRHGEQQLLSIVIPLGMLIGLSTLPLLDSENPVNLVFPLTLGVSIMSAGFTGQAISVAFDRRYGALKRIGASGVPPWTIIFGKVVAVIAVCCFQALILGITAGILGWRPTFIGFGLAAIVFVIGVAAFTALGLLVGGTLNSELVLALANLLWFIMVAAASYALIRSGDAIPHWLLAVPSVALADAMSQAFLGHLPLLKRVSTSTPIDQHETGKNSWLDRFSFGVRIQRFWALLLLFAQGGITVTGSIVRVTGSGLGCTSWPDCQQGSLVPISGAAPAIHQAIEFGNRMLAVILAVLALIVFLMMLAAKRRREIVVLAFIQGLGVILQAVIGGISVHLELRWWAVALHFLPSMLLVWLGAILYQRISEPDDGDMTHGFPSPLRYLAVGSAVALAVVLMTGTMVTGAGVHSGDDGVGMEGRLNVDIAEMAHIHAHFMYLYLGLTVGLVAALVTVKASSRALKFSWWLIAMIVVQAAVGIIQYNFGIPRWTVPVHVALSGVVTGFTGLVYAQAFVRQYT